MFVLVISKHILYRPCCDLVVQANWKTCIEKQIHGYCWRMECLVFLWMSWKYHPLSSELFNICLRLSKLCVLWSDENVRNDFQSAVSFYWCSVLYGLSHELPCRSTMYLWYMSNYVFVWHPQYFRLDHKWVGTWVREMWFHIAMLGPRYQRTRKSGDSLIFCLHLQQLMWLQRNISSSWSIGYGYPDQYASL